MNRRGLFLSVMLLTALAVGPSAAVRGAEGDSDAGGRSIAELIADLDSDQYAVREKATRALIEVGHEVIEPLAAVAEEGTLEASARALRILQELYAGSPEGKTLDAVEIALETLAESSNRSSAARAERVLSIFDDRRQQRALRHIERLGGSIAYMTENDPFFDPENPTLKYVVLGSRWKGGDEGLKYIRRLSKLELLFLSGARDALPISKEAEQALLTALPRLTIQHRGAAYLGIQGTPVERGCQVLQVNENAAADKAGVRQGDVIIALGGEKIDGFETLIGELKKYAPGDKVKIGVLRGADELTLDLVMDEWK